MPKAPAAQAGRLRDAFRAADYTTSGVEQRLGPVAANALARHETVPARRATRGGDPLDTLVRLFLLQLVVDARAAAAALPLDVAVPLGVVRVDGGDVRATVDVRPYTEGTGAGGQDLWWVVSDLGTGLDGRHERLPAEHVLGVGGASTMLAQLTPRDPVGTTLDIGTGSGVQTLHAGKHSGIVVGTDLSERALLLAGLTTALSDVAVELRQGSLLEPVADLRADLVVSNPPFVVRPSPARGSRVHTYRDAGLHLDDVCARLVHDAPALLTEGGDLVMLLNWVHLRGADWRDRVGSWLPSGVDALVVQREVLDPAEYVATWLRDSGQVADTEAYDVWLQGLEDSGVEAVGMGFARLRRSGSSPAPALVDWPHAVEQPLAPHLSGWLDRRSWLAALDDRALLGTRLRVADDVVQEQVGRPGAEDPEHIVLRRHRGMRGAERVDTATAALVGACEATLPTGALIAAVARLLGDDPSALQQRLLPAVRGLVEQGVLEPG